MHAALNLSRILDPNFMAPEDVGPKDRWHAALAVAARKGEWSWPATRHSVTPDPLLVLARADLSEDELVVCCVVQSHEERRVAAKAAGKAARRSYTC